MDNTKSSAPEIIETRISAQVWQALLEVYGPAKPSLCVNLLRTLVEIHGNAGIENRLAMEWKNLSEEQHFNIAYAAAEPHTMRTEFAIRLFEDSLSTVHVKHLILSGLMRSADTRHCHSEIMELSNRIGAYADPVKQAALCNLIQRWEMSVNKRSKSISRSSGLPKSRAKLMRVESVKPVKVQA